MKMPFKCSKQEVISEKGKKPDCEKYEQEEFIFSDLLNMTLIPHPNRLFLHIKYAKHYNLILQQFNMNFNTEKHKIYNKSVNNNCTI